MSAMVASQAGAWLSAGGFACSSETKAVQLTADHLRSQCLAGKVLPIEILPLGEFDPVYRSTLDVQNGELPVLPLSIYGAVRRRPH